jgi:hypothetical protein
VKGIHIMSKISLTLFKQLVKEFEDAILANEKMRELEDYDRSNYVIEMSKAMGLAAGIANEVTLLIGDIKVLVNQVSTGQDSASKGLSDLLGLTKTGLGGSGGLSGQGGGPTGAN